MNIVDMRDQVKVLRAEAEAEGKDGRVLNAQSFKGAARTIEVAADEIVELRTDIKQYARLSGGR